MVRRWFWQLTGGLLVVLVLLLWLSPSEQTLGQLVKLIYLHGAMVRTAMALFAVGLPVNLAALVTGKQSWSVWGRALVWAAVSIWLVHTLLSIISTYAAWGVWIAWYEPRVRFTFIGAAVGVIVVGVAYVVNEQRFTAGAFTLITALTLALLPRLELVQHPLNPIGTSPSSAIRAFYTAILLVCLALGGMLTVWLRQTARS